MVHFAKKICQQKKHKKSQTRLGRHSQTATQKVSTWQKDTDGVEFLVLLAEAKTSSLVPIQ